MRVKLIETLWENFKFPSLVTSSSCIHQPSCSNHIKGIVQRRKNNVACGSCVTTAKSAVHGPFCRSLEEGYFEK